MAYLILPKDGERADTRLVNNFTEAEIIDKKKQGYVVVGEEDFNLLIGNGDKQYCIADDGTLYERPPYVPPLEDVQARKIAELNSIRDAKDLEPITTDKGTFDFDESAQKSIDLALKVAQIQGIEKTNWTLYDNTEVEVTVEDLNNVILTAGVRKIQNHAKCVELKNKVRSCTTNEEVEEIEWEWKI